MRSKEPAQRTFGRSLEIVQKIADHYLTSGDFNGYPVRQMAGDFGMESIAAISILRTLIQRGRITIVTAADENPYVKRFPELPKAKQIELLESRPLESTCAYPSRSHLRRIVNRSRYRNRPFTMRLALGEPQLAFRVFDVAVLEAYRNDPRYIYHTDDIGGYILLRSGQGMSDSDKTSLQTFGFAYNKGVTRRAIAVFLRYLSNLNPRHQRIWHAKELRGSYALHPDYFRGSILGRWYEGISVFDALIEELHCIDDMCRLIGWQPLFVNVFRDGAKPKEFHFLIRPTLREFNAFVLLLDKVLSENINPTFFEGQIAAETEHVRKDKKVEVRRKGTIQMFEEWINLRFRTPDRKPIDEAIANLKVIRRMRQKPAHAIEEDAFHQKYYQRQREIMAKAYSAVNTVRLLLAGHPKARAYSVSAVLKDGPIWMQ